MGVVEGDADEQVGLVNVVLAELASNDVLVVGEFGLADVGGVLLADCVFLYHSRFVLFVYEHFLE